MTCEAYSVPLAALAAYSPYKHAVWDISRPITRWEVRKALREERLTPPPEWSATSTRAEHIRRVAWLVHNGWEDPIELDVGIPFLVYGDWWVADGNHRHAAAIFRGDTHIQATISGQLEYAEEVLGVKFHDTDAIAV